MRVYLFSALVGAAASARAASTVVLPGSSFSSYASLQQYWGYLYPWGSDHNGSARMLGNASFHEYISVANNVLTLTAKPTSGQPPSTSNPHPAIHYFSGTVHALQQITVGGGTTGFDVYGEFAAPVAKGTWPAFWLTAVSGWPPEADVGEWKGTDQVWFNTFNTSSAVASKIVAWPTAGFHSVKAALRTIPGNTRDLSIGYYLDGALQATHTAAGFYGQALWLIVDLQMEGSSGSPGPANGATYQIRNVSLTQYT